MGLDTLYRKVDQLKDTDKELYKKFITLHPYKPRDISGIDFKQLMRECILTGISQSQLADKYGISKRTIQRKFAIIKKEDEELFEIYKMFIDNEEIAIEKLIKIQEEYIPQHVLDFKERLENRKKEFSDRIKGCSNLRQVKQYYKEQIRRVENQIQTEIEGDEK